LSWRQPFLALGDAGPLLHFAHGNGYPPSSYRQFLTALAADFQVRACFHRPLWPDSDPKFMTRWSDLAGDLIDLFDQEGWRDVIGVGHSLGSVLTLHAAVRRPDLFRALVFVDPVFLPPPILEMVASGDMATAFYDMQLAQSARRRRDWWPDRDEAFARFRAKSVFARMSDDAVWDYVNSITRPAADGNGVTLAYPKAWEAHIYSNLPTDVWEQLHRLQQPALAVRAGLSRTLMVPAWEHWQANWPQMKFVELPDVTHLLTFEEPAAVAAVVRQFAATLAPPTPSS